MSVSFSAQDLQPTYQALVDGSADYDWAIFNQSGNELKVQGTGNGLDDLSDEFMDGRCVVVIVVVAVVESNVDERGLTSLLASSTPLRVSRTPAYVFRPPLMSID